MIEKQPLEYHLKNMDVFYALSYSDIKLLREYVSAKYNGLILTPAGDLKLYGITNTHLHKSITMNNKQLLPLVFKLCARFFGQNEDSAKSKSRKREFVEVRMYYYKYAYNELKCSYKSIGEVVNGRDHSTVISGINELEDLMDTDRTCIAKYNNLLAYLEKELETTPHQANGDGKN